MTTSTTFNDMQTVKRSFFALRNGIVADTLRKGGTSYKIIFGLNLPQICEIAASTPHDPKLAQMLWDNVTTRESRLLAPMLLNPATTDRTLALRWASEVNEREVADVLCLKLLRKMPGAAGLIEGIASADNPLAEYTALRLALNIVREAPSEARNAARSHRNSDSPAVRHLCTRIEEELQDLAYES